MIGETLCKGQGGSFLHVSNPEGLQNGPFRKLWRGVTAVQEAISTVGGPSSWWLAISKRSYVLLAKYALISNPCGGK